MVAPPPFRFHFVHYVFFGKSYNRFQYFFNIRSCGHTAGREAEKAAVPAASAEKTTLHPR
ncbi:hypothetical protein HMPREF1546_01270 [Oscillibacter sp. KLE 1745]|nr:hypothetical protein HMPREF1546_01270 [Oscillibacter sp. KLE 1745]